MENFEDVIKISDGIEIENVSGTKPTFKTNEVARQLNESDQTIRNYCKEFATELGEIETTTGGHRIFSYENINMLREIIRMCKVDKMSYAQIHEELAARANKLVSVSESEKYFSDTIRKLFIDLVDIKEITSSTYEVVETIYQDLNNQAEVIKKQEGIIENQTNIINMMNETLSRQEKLITEVINNQEKMASDMIESKRGKKLFGIFLRK